MNRFWLIVFVCALQELYTRKQLITQNGYVRKGFTFVNDD